MTNIAQRRGTSAQAAADPIAAMVDEHGVLTADAERAANVSDAELRDLYRLMAIARRLDQEGVNLQRQGEIGLWGPINGHEAIQIGAATAMADADWIFPYYRDFGMAIARGVDPGVALTWFRGLNHGPWDPRELRFGPGIISVGSQMPHGVGFAIGCKLDHEPIAVLTCSGEGATSTGDWHESMNFAGVFQAPVVVLCENNQWAISVPFRQQVAGHIADRAAGYGFPGLRVDGTDVLTVHAVVRAAAERARRGGGPYLVEALTYRFQPHTTSDDPTRYRDEADAAPWRAKDPLANAEARLRARGAWDDAFAEQTAQAAEEAATNMRQTLLNAPPPHPGIVFDQVYANPPDSLLREKAEFVSSLESGGAE
ncbi:MAG TPA: thiamine pyrophosphate-dependent enzyme [Ktedonobacterales bacterium]|nr:thiamine pyrophosphate-dependent enzyme [Ktedonobacterales bacterium]